MISRTNLKDVVDALVEVIFSENRAAKYGTQPGNALCLTLWEDGSGRIGRRAWHSTNEVEDWHEFDTLDELIQKLRDEGIEVEE